MPCQAYTEYKRIRPLVAFNISRDAKRKNINQHLRIYTFPDGSELYIYRSGKALVPYQVCGLLKVNSFGV